MFNLIVVILLVSPIVSFGADVAWEDCGQADRSLVFTKVGLKSPLVVDSHQPIDIDVAFDVLDPLDSNVQISTDLRRYFSVLGIQSSVKIPCINDVGSCSGSFCHFVQSYSDLARSFAEQLNVPFSCELNAGHIQGTVNYNIKTKTFSRIPSVLLSAASGTYELVIRWTSNGHEIGCLALHTQIDIRS
ncbi:uncharacterized protein LOC128386948 [Panonychus citri]|uniref:uncharacterized protein LOC128386948 n=1 Tax=Panonychus citri TaxID=50023 RepID=UPI002307C5F1|nr:uncharacterized protein LOC128386948 [Panonychus citri]